MRRLGGEGRLGGVRLGGVGRLDGVRWLVKWGLGGVFGEVVRLGAVEVGWSVWVEREFGGVQTLGEVRRLGGVGRLGELGRLGEVRRLVKW